jgi:hypothetical protein
MVITAYPVAGTSYKFEITLTSEGKKDDTEIINFITSINSFGPRGTIYKLNEIPPISISFQATAH